MNKLRLNWFIVSIMLSTLACSLPGLSIPSEIPTPDQNSLSTIIAGTANAAAMQTAQTNPLASTPLPVSTETAAPTSTATPTPRISTEGTSLVKQSDGSYIFTDYQGGYSVIVPSGWLAVRPNEQEYMNAWSLPSASDPRFQDFLNKLQQEDPKLFRLAAANISPENLPDDLISTFTITWDRNSTLTLEQEVSQAQKEIKTLKGLKITYADTGATSTHIPMAIIETSVENTKNFYGKIINAYQKVVIFKVKNGILAFTFTTMPRLKDAILQGFDLMTDQINMLP